MDWILPVALSEASLFCVSFCWISAWNWRKKQKQSCFCRSCAEFYWRCSIGGVLPSCAAPEHSRQLEDPRTWRCFNSKLSVLASDLSGTIEKIQKFQKDSSSHRPYQTWSSLKVNQFNQLGLISLSLKFSLCQFDLVAQSNCSKW